jgi:NDP-sugar pyrophosphorylase family protein
VLAGGRGTRLAPYTSILPKPLMPIGEASILELVISQLGRHGITRVTLSVGYLAHLIQAVLDHTDQHGIQLDYVRESEPLGTAAPLRLIENLDTTFIAMNGDVLTDLDYGDLIRQHKLSGSVLTIATKDRTVKIDYGVLDLGERDDFACLTGFTEKPQIHYTVSMGVYVLEPEALEYIPPTGAFDVPDLVRCLLADDQPVGAYRHDGLWFDIGRPDDYIEANSIWLQRAAEAEASFGTANAFVPEPRAGIGPKRTRTARGQHEDSAAIAPTSSVTPA